MEKNIEVSLLLDFYGNLLKPEGRQMVDLYYNDDLSLAEVAEQIGITPQGVRDRVRRCENQLFEFEEKLGLFKRFQQLENGLDKIEACAFKIQNGTADKNIQGLAYSIRQTASGLKE